jgi:hypothetical protein
VHRRPRWAILVELGLMKGGPVTLGDIAGKITMLEVTCSRCEWHGRLQPILTYALDQGGLACAAKLALTTGREACSIGVSCVCGSGAGRLEGGAKQNGRPSCRLFSRD